MKLSFLNKFGQNATYIQKNELSAILNEQVLIHILGLILFLVSVMQFDWNIWAFLASPNVSEFGHFQDWCDMFDS